LKRDMHVIERLQAWGHPEIRAAHKTTLQITKETHLTGRGDCIVATRASKGAADLLPEFSRLAKNNNTSLTLTITAAERSEIITGRGDDRLTLSHPSDLVARKSAYVCPRTLMVQSDKSASDLSREFVRTLRDPSLRITVEILAEL